ncbi:hypothetical protein ACQUY5_24235 [Bacillus cereus]|uniref:hypothetical protein n=1 Tax=Bacillus cereus TaxID=1396 RepID=UPI003D186CDC
MTSNTIENKHVTISDLKEGVEFYPLRDFHMSKRQVIVQREGIYAILSELGEDGKVHTKRMYNMHKLVDKFKSIEVIESLRFEFEPNIEQFLELDFYVGRSSAIGGVVLPEWKGIVYSLEPTPNSHVGVVDTFEDTETEVVVKICSTCRKEKKFTVSSRALQDWENGQLIQRAFPNMKAPDRELFRGGMCGDCWDRMFPSEE